MTQRQPLAVSDTLGPTDAAINEVVAAIGRASSILAVCHVSPDGDAIGSLLAFGAIAKHLGKPCVLACADPVPEMLQFLPGVNTIVRRASGPFDLAVGLDASDPRRLGDLFARHAQADASTLNIDHHITNLRFAAVNWIDLTAAATAEMMFLLADHLQAPLTRALATSLLTGLVTDTRGFRTNGTSARVLQMASRLVQAGAPLFQIMEMTLERRSLAQIHLWGRVLSRARLHGRILWSDVTAADRQAVGIKENGSDAGLSSFLASALEADVSAIFVERNGKIEVSLRACPGFSVSEAALALGGGGHPLAAGCNIEGSLADARRLVLAALDNSLAGQGFPQPFFDEPA
ncbi:MAG: bifunctional oligoribonuclease/PAP phosphatase NrnA [Anaerolineae bacterium]